MEKKLDIIDEKKTYDDVLNYNEENISDLNDHINSYHNNNVYTLVQLNSACDVQVEQKSRENIAKIILG